MKICYFTASGNCLYVARRIGGEDAELLSIPQLMKRDSIQIVDEAVGIVAPVYAVELPAMVKEFLEKAVIETEYLFVIMTCGYGYEAALGHAELAARARGWDLKYTNGVLMVDNYLPMFDMREEMAKLSQKDVEGQLDAICADIRGRKEKRLDLSDELRAQMDWYHENHEPKIMGKDMAQSYIVNDSCINCGICEKVCPADNIQMGSNGPVFAQRCEVCYACLHNCPQGAIRLPQEKGTARFRNEHVSLRDIIEANA